MSNAGAHDPVNETSIKNCVGAVPRLPLHESEITGYGIRSEVLKSQQMLKIYILCCIIPHRLF
jgi:hypothetical protein